MKKRLIERPGFARALCALAGAWLLLVNLSCGHEENPAWMRDSTAPARIEDFAVASVTCSSATLRWTAPGDNGIEGRASQYDIRYSSEFVPRASNWVDAFQAVGEPDPANPGEADSLVVRKLSPATKYYFAIRTADERPNWSPISDPDSAVTDSLGKK
ncbi:MAG: fibronectin type III domain-containing protein [Candidatus Eisenbacteria bacterium]|nr:fibronectin type III domain-containing protein [Candidatus Eisenbacteria bacterium]